MEVRRIIFLVIKTLLGALDGSCHACIAFAALDT